MSTEETIHTCDCCDYEGPVSRFYQGGKPIDLGVVGSKVILVLCMLCANTKVSSLARYPDYHSTDLMNTLKTICKVGNLILDEIQNGNQGG